MVTQNKEVAGVSGKTGKVGTPPPTIPVTILTTGQGMMPHAQFLMKMILHLRLEYGRGELRPVGGSLDITDLGQTRQEIVSSICLLPTSV